MNEISAIDFVKNLGMGINIGNSLDVIGQFYQVKDETGWNNPKISREYIKALRDYGYKTIRLPVTWADHMGPAPEYKILESKIGRVEEVVNWILSEDLNAIINLHHDGGQSLQGWILKAATDPKGVANQLGAVWEQIAQRFSGVGQDKLIFESMNEIGFERLWKSREDSTVGKDKAYNTLLMLNQTFVDSVRSTPGNKDRFLLIPGYFADIKCTCDPVYRMPEDTEKDKLILSVHFFTPSSFCIFEKPHFTEGYRDTWGTDEDYRQQIILFQLLKKYFIDKNIPVILGEYSVNVRKKDPESRVKWMTSVTRQCLDLGICPVLWDTGKEISRHPPFEMKDTLKAVWEQVADKI